MLQRAMDPFEFAICHRDARTRSVLADKRIVRSGVHDAYRAPCSPDCVQCFLLSLRIVWLESVILLLLMLKSFQRS